MASEGTNNTSSATNSSAGAPRSWVNPTNALVSDSTYTTATIAGRFSGNDFSEYLQVRDFGFAIPSGATIDGIVIEIRAYRSSAWTDGSGFYVMKGSNFHGSSNTSFPTSVAYTTYGTSSSLWSTTWTPAEINDSGFGVNIFAECNNNDATDGRITYIDHVRITVYYTEGGSGAELRKNPVPQSMQTLLTR